LVETNYDQLIVKEIFNSAPSTGESIRNEVYDPGSSGGVTAITQTKKRKA